ncbi:MAG: radical SAM protein [Cytophagales bacterium]|nr:MAG: radical SAM protein [Cytophagales bacterium]
MRLIKQPVLCNYYVTYRCNATCKFCDIWEKPSPYITLEQVSSNLKDLKKLGVKIIDFTGGEPLLHREIDKILRLSKELGFITTLTTNTLLYPKLAEKISGLIDMLHFSLDSADESVHNQSRGVECFGSLMDSIQIAKSLGERPDILFTVFDHNLHEIDKIYHNISQPNGSVLILNPVFEYNQIGSSLSIASLEHLSKWGKKKNVYLNEAFIKLRKDGGNKINQPVCKAASSTIVISPENQLVLPCYHLGIENIPIENNLYQLYNSKEIKNKIALEGRMPACQGCVINCYMQPSFAVEVNKYFWLALPSTVKYNLMKGTWKKLFIK